MRLIDGKGDGAGDGVGRDGELVAAAAGLLADFGLSMEPASFGADEAGRYRRRPQHAVG